MYETQSSKYIEFIIFYKKSFIMQQIINKDGRTMWYEIYRIITILPNTPAAKAGIDP